jgi:hypothetical protein
MNKKAIIGISVCVVITIFAIYLIAQLPILSYKLLFTAKLTWIDGARYGSPAYLYFDNGRVISWCRSTENLVIGYTYMVTGDYSGDYRIEVVTSPQTEFLCKPNPILKGDCNHDGKVNTKDVKIMRHAWLSVRGYKNYNPNCDFNKDGIVNVLDAVWIGINWKV